MQLKTLAEMAAKYRKSTKTFRRQVIAENIPHEKLGRSMLFDEVAVSAYLHAKATEPKPNVVRFPTRKMKKRTSRFAEAVGV